MADRFVVDCSVAAKWVLPDDGRAPALKWLEAHPAGDLTLIAPDILLAEFTSSIAKLHRRKLLSTLAAHDAYAFMLQCAPELYETRTRLRRALVLSLEYHLSLWDCIYLALAEEFDCPVLTSDMRLVRGTQGRHPSIRFVH
jgi:predicted nucleic acid-binding protein